MYRKIIITAFLSALFAQITGCGCTRPPPDEPKVPGIYLGLSVAKEGNSGTNILPVPVDLVPARNREITVDYEVVAVADVDLTQFNDLLSNETYKSLAEKAIASGDYEAVPGEDYVPLQSGTLVIPAGEDGGIISLKMIGDELYEHDEVVVLRLTRADTDIKQAENVAIIANDDAPPVVSITMDGSTSLTEQAGEKRTFSVSLDKPSGIDTVLGFGLNGVSGLDQAVFRGDYTIYDEQGEQIISNEAITIPVGEQLAVFELEVVDDGVDEDEESIRIELQSQSLGDASIHATDNELVMSIAANTENNAGFAALNDTGVTKIVSTGNTTLDAQQDSQFGRDVTSNNSSDGIAGFHFTKLDASGKPLADQSVTWSDDDPTTQWSCVKDEVTGLVWEMKNRVGGGLGRNNNTISWYEPDMGANGGYPGTVGNEDCDGLDCNTLFLSAQRNLSKLCGMTGWRVPTIEELRTLANYGLYESKVSDQTAIDYAYFPDVTVYPFWSSTTTHDVTRAFTMKFDATLEETTNDKTRTIAVVRLVNDQQSNP